MRKIRFRLTHTQIIAAGFLLMILIGAALLCLPVSSRDGSATPFADALFTSVSASCVTGLVVFDTATHWSCFGQAVLFVLIQTGGLGFMTFITFFFMALGKRVGLKERQLMTESINASNIGSVISITRTILAGTLICEFSGACLLAVRFIPRFGVGKGIWFSLFHSVSAFCNAGFDLLGEGNEYVSFCEYSADPLVNITLVLLITVGGLGFLVWDDLAKHRFRVGRYRLQTKIVLTMTAVLTFGGGLLFFFFERNATGAGLPVGERILSSIFDSVTARTAGFNTTDTAALSEPSVILTYLMMFIGGSPGSTAGGVKTVTVAVLIAYVVSGARKSQSASLFGRKIGKETLKQSVFVVGGNLTAALAASMIIGSIQRFSVRDLLFECFSAVGTVGMSTGITRDLLPLSRILICLLMYIGRVGSVSFALAVMEKRAKPQVSYPSEPVSVG